MNKSEATKRILAGAIESFDHELLGMFNVTEMRMAAAMGLYGEPMLSRLDQSVVDFVMKNREVDLVRVGEILADDKVLDDPVLGLFDPRANETTLCDGSHRLVARWKKGLREFAHYRIPLAQAVRIDRRLMYEIPWGEKDLVPGVGLVKRT